MLRALVATVTLAAMCASPVVAVACMASTECPLQVDERSRCHEQGPADGAPAGGGHDAPDGRDCCSSLLLPMAKKEGPALAPLAPLGAAGMLEIARPSLTPGPGAIGPAGEHRGGGARLGLLCVLLI